jgi:hypothetical protein
MIVCAASSCSGSGDSIAVEFGTGDGHEDVDAASAARGELDRGGDGALHVVAALEGHEDRLVLGLAVGDRQRGGDLDRRGQVQALAAPVDDVHDDAERQPEGARGGHGEVEDGDHDEREPGAGEADDRERRQRVAPPRQPPGAAVRAPVVGLGDAQADDRQVGHRERQHRPNA